MRAGALPKAARRVAVGKASRRWALAGSPAANLIASADVETCVEVLEALLSDDRGRTAWLMGFLVGSAMREESDPA